MPNEMELQAENSALRQRVAELEARLGNAPDDFRARYQALFDNPHTPMLIIEQQTGQIVDANQAACIFYGWSRAELVTMNIAQINTLSPEEIQAEMEKAKNSPFGWRFHFRHRIASGQVRDVEVSSGRLALDGKDLLFSIITDVTQRKLAEAALVASEKRLRDVFETMQEGFYLAELVVDADGKPLTWRWLDANPACCRILGVKREDLVGHTVKERYPQVDDDWLGVMFHTALSGQPAQVEGFHKDTGLYVQSSYFSQREGQFACIFTDITARKKAEQQLEYQAQLLEHVNDAVVASDDNYRITFWNRAAERLYGWKAEEVLGNTGIEFLKTEFPESDRETMLEVIRKSGNYRGEVTQARKDGTRIAVEVHSIVIYNQLGQVVGFVSVNRDFQERKQAEADAEQSRARLLTALESMTDAVFISDAHGNYVEFNEAFATYYRFKNKAECATTFAEYLEIIEVFLPDGRPAPVDKWAAQRALRGETRTNEIYTLRRKDTGETWVGSYSFAPIRDPNGEISGSVVVVRDITGQKRSEERLARLMERLDLATRSAEMGVWDWDIVKNELVWDDQMYTLYGLRPGEFHGAYEAWLQGVHPDDRAASDAVSQRAIHGNGEYDTEFRVVWPDGSVHWLKADGQVFRDENGNPLRMVGINYDITESKLAEEALRKSEAILRENGEKLRVALAAAHLGVWRLDISTGMIQCDERARAIFGFRDDPLIPLDLYHQAIAPEDRLMAKDAVDRAIAEYTDFQVELRILPPGGKLTWVVNMGSAEYDEQGRAVATNGVVLDITERKQAEEAIRLKDRLLHMTTEMGKIGGWEFDARTLEGTWTDDVARIHDLDPGDPTNVAKGTSFYYGESRERIEQAIRGAIELAEPYDLELEMISAAGTKKWVRTMGLPVLENDQVILVRGIFQDITERKLTEQRIRHISRLYATLSQINQAIVRAKSPEELYPQICDIAIQFGQYRLAWIGLVDAESGELHPLAHAGVDDGLFPKRRYRIDETQYTNLPVSIALRENRVCVLSDIQTGSDEDYWRKYVKPFGYRSMACVPFRRGGKPVGLLNIYSIHDDNFSSDEQRLLEEISLDISFALDSMESDALRRQVEQRMEATLREKEALLREVHHRVKNNLQAMIALMEMQSAQTEDAEMKQFLKELEGRARTMALVYEQLYQSDTLAQVAMEPYLFQLVTSIIETFGRSQAISLALEIDPVSLDVAQAMPSGLIINELVTNVLKHAFPPGFSGRAELLVRLRAEESQVIISVADNGSGFRPGSGWKTSQSLGLRLVMLWATHQLGGTLEQSGPPGNCFTITFKK